MPSIRLVGFACFMIIQSSSVSAQSENAINSAVTLDDLLVDDSGTPLLSELPSSLNYSNGYAASFDEIALNGLENACYLDDDHYVAEFLYQHPDACFWSVDHENRVVSEVSVPSIPDDAIYLPPPSGRDDTDRVQEIINANSGRSIVGQGVYQINNLKIRVPVTLFNMPMQPYNNAYQLVSVRSPDVHIYNSPIDGLWSSNTNIGFEVKDGSDRFVLVNSGFSNVSGRNNRNTTGVLLRGVNDYHIACNRFENILNAPNTTSGRHTARANAIWMNGGGNTSTSGGVIANNYAENLQSTGFLKDAEFITIQQYIEDPAAEPVKIFANRAINAGKRLSKHQSSGARVLSNSYDWRDRQGPLGDRRMFAVINVQRSNNVSARNNRIMVGGFSKFDFIFHTNAKVQGYIQDNIHFDCNAIEVRDPLLAGNGSAPAIIGARAASDSNNGKFEATNSTALNNVATGTGDVMSFYNFGKGYRRTGGQFDISGNQFSIRYTQGIFR